MKEKYKIVFMGGKQAGMVVLLSLLATEDVIAVIAYDNMIKTIAEGLGIATFESVNDPRVQLDLLMSDLLVCSHGRQIVNKEELALPRIGCINVHPCLYKYKGIRPIPRMLRDGETMASVGVHWMIEKVDEGRVIAENFMEVKGKTPEAVYNELYPLYVTTILEAIQKIKENDGN